MNQTGISQFNQARIEWAIRLRYSPMPDLNMERITRQLNEFRIGELRTVGKTWELMMERDGELAINSEKRKADSATLDWQIAGDGSPDGDKHAAALQYFYNNLTATKALDQDATGGVDELIYQALSALDYYYSAHEILLRVDNPAAREVTAEFRHTPVWFFEARRGYLGYLKHIFDLYGQPCIAGEWLTAVNTGWMRPLSVAYGAKWSVIPDWLTFCERYGSGFLEGITEAAKDSTEWNEAQEALEKLTNDASVLHHRNVEFKFLEHPHKNQLPFQPMMELVDRLYAKCYRGVDLATGSRGAAGSGTAGGAEGGKNPVGASVQREESGILLVRDAKWVTGVFNERIDRPIIRYLFNEEPRAWFALVPPLNDTTAENLQSLRTLVPMGLRVALKEVYQRFRWSVPAAGEACLGVSPKSNVQSPTLATESPESTVHSPQSENGAPGSAPDTSGPASANPEDGEQKAEDGAPPDSKTFEDDPPSSDSGATRDDSENPDARKSYIVNRKSTENKTLPAQTTESTPIAAGADPARNPGLVPPRFNASTLQRFSGAPSRQTPDTQVDGGAFWSRVGLAPRGADGQVLPMPSLGYAVPNASTLEPIKNRLKDLIARGLGHCRAAQALQHEISRREQQIRTQSASLLANDDFNPEEPRDKDGKWTTGGNAGTATNSPPQAGATAKPETPIHVELNPLEKAEMAGASPDPEHQSFEHWLTPEKEAYYDQLMQPKLRPFTWWEKTRFDLRQLMFKWLPGTRPSGQPSPGKVLGAVSMLLPFGVGPETRLGKLLTGYFAVKTAAEQPAYYHAIKHELQTGNYSDAGRHSVEDLLKIGMVGAGVHGAVGGEGPKGPGAGEPPVETGESGRAPEGTRPDPAETGQQRKGEQAGKNNPTGDSLPDGWSALVKAEHFTLAERQAVSGLIKDGKVFAIGDPQLGHAELAKKSGVELVNGKLPKGMEGFLAQKIGGKIGVIGAGINGEGHDWPISEAGKKVAQTFFK